VLGGEVRYQGEDDDDKGVVRVTANRVEKVPDAQPATA
jgi:hypothetical protein